MKTDFYMQKALEIANQSGDDVPVGAVIVYNDKIIAQCHNQKEILNDVTAHAEILAIRKAENTLNNWRLEGCDLYVTLEPCPMCASAIINSRISNIYFGAYDSLYGAFGSALDMRKIFNSKINVLGGIMEKECSKLLTEYWRKNGQKN